MPLSVVRPPAAAPFVAEENVIAGNVIAYGATFENGPGGFDATRREAMTCGIDGVPELRAAVSRLVALGPAAAKPAKLFLLWNAADWIYRRQTPEAEQRSLAELMAYDLHEMSSRDYLQPIIAQVAD